MPLAFRTVHPDFRSRNGFIWPFPGSTATAKGPCEVRSTDPCPDYDGDGLCLALTAEGAASGGIPMHTVLVCSYDEADVLGQNKDKIRVRKARVESVHDFPAVLRGVTPHTVPLPTKANLYGANLYGANLYGAYLSEADLSEADLSRADLSEADLSEADLSRADLSEADLSRANLSRANLYGANLSRANLYGANLYGAYLSRANLSRANLSRADLSGADFYGAQHDRYTVWPEGHKP